jgi:hypothetical protein
MEPSTGKRTVRPFGKAGSEYEVRSIGLVFHRLAWLTVGIWMVLEVVAAARDTSPTGLAALTLICVLICLSFSCLTVMNGRKIEKAAKPVKPYGGMHETVQKVGVLWDRSVVVAGSSG